MIDPAWQGSVWTTILEWLDRPLGFEHVITGFGVLVLPAMLLLVIFAIADS